MNINLWTIPRDRFFRRIQHARNACSRADQQRRAGIDERRYELRPGEIHHRQHRLMHVVVYRILHLADHGIVTWRLSWRRPHAELPADRILRLVEELFYKGLI